MLRRSSQHTEVWRPMVGLRIWLIGPKAVLTQAKRRTGTAPARP